MKSGQKIQFINTAFALALAILVTIGWLSYRNTTAMVESDRWEDHAYATIQEYDKLLSALQDEETGQRGYIITGEDEYLEPYNNTIKDVSQRMASLRILTEDSPQQQDRLKALKALIDEKMAVVKEGVELRRSKGFEAAFHFMATDRGQALMDEIGRRIADDEAREMKMLRERAKEKASDVRRSVLTVFAGSSLSFLLLFSVFIALKKEIFQRTIAENELLLHRSHLQERINERALELERANSLLQNEIQQHKEAEQALRQARDELELRIKERTAELAQTVTVLHNEAVQRSLTERTLRERSDQLRLLASELTMAEHRERERLAQVLHDGLQQTLVGAKYMLALIGSGEDVDRSVAEVVNHIDDAIKTSRSLTAELSPPILHQRGLIPALEWLAGWMQTKYGLTMSLTVREPAEAIPEDISIFLFQAIRELLFNVVKHAGIDTVRLDITQQDDQIRVAVTDQGAGFDPAQLRAAGGTAGGFGLFSLSERISHLHGRMEIESSPGKGSRITLLAPVSPIARSAPPLLTEKQEFLSAAGKVEIPGDSSEKRFRVVLVDDHMILRQGLASLLKEQPLLQVVGEAPDGKTALNLIRGIRPDVVLMDIGLPDINGVEVTQIIHEELPEVRIIGLSMFDESEQAAAMRKAGAIDYVAKNGPSETLIAAIMACIPVQEHTEKTFSGEGPKSAASSTATVM